MEWNMCFRFRRIANHHYHLLDLAWFSVSFLLFLFPKGCVLYSFLPVLFLFTCFLILQVLFNNPDPVFTITSLWSHLQYSQVRTPWKPTLTELPRTELYSPWPSLDLTSTISPPGVGPFPQMGLHNSASFHHFHFFNSAKPPFMPCLSSLQSGHKVLNSYHHLSNTNARANSHHGEIGERLLGRF